MVDRSAMGAEGAPFRFDMESGKIREFARAVGASDPAHFLPGGEVSPATFLTAMAHWEPDVEGSNPWPLVKIDQKRGMHAEQEYIFHGAPPKAGDSLTCTSKITDIFDKESRGGGKLTFIVMTTEFRDPQGRLIAEAKLTAVETPKLEK